MMPTVTQNERKVTNQSQGKDFFDTLRDITPGCLGFLVGAVFGLVVGYLLGGG